MEIQPGLPSPAVVLETLNAFQRTGALKAAVELDLFTAVAGGCNSVDLLAKRLQASERGVRILCDYLVVIGFLTKQDSRYSLVAETAPFVDRNSPYFIADAGQFLASHQLVEAFIKLAQAVRKGGTVMGDEGALAPEHPIWVEYARAMSSSAALSARLVADVLELDPSGSYKILDIAAGHGMYGITLATASPKAQVTALDWPNVLEVAKENAKKAGVSDRYQVIPGSAFAADYGEDYDVVMLTNFLHHFDQPTCESVLKKVHRALKPGGRAVTVEFVPNEDRVSPPQAAAFALVMLVNTPAGDSYTFAELEQMFKNAGFPNTRLHSLSPSPQSALISERG